MSLCLFALLTTPFVSGFAADEEKTWEGRWNNRKFNTSGPLKCVAKETEAGKWKATFSGTFMGDPFTYDVEFESKAGRAQTDLGGKAVIRGDEYEWSGFIKGKQLNGRYRSGIGYFGEFVLTEAKAAR
ncbi:MAG: hypothetical protein B7Z55_10890 [Planctomycetales bacterium 12-60-4]|nr:MAG: hypothetical protein B7Z55_10890 [Planctomycetales bacterium 12-60-4]